MEKVIVLTGKPGAGKGTRLTEFLTGREGQYFILSVGNLLRKARQEQTELGKKASHYMDAGELVPDELINELVIDAIKSAKHPVITDGFPRTVVQAKAMLNADIYPDIVVDLYVDDEVVIQRAKSRLVCKECGEPYTTNSYKPPKKEGVCDRCGGQLVKREDDREEVVRNRLRVYATETQPVMDVFVNANIKVHTIDNTDANAGRMFKLLLEE